MAVLAIAGNQGLISTGGSKGVLVTLQSAKKHSRVVPDEQSSTYEWSFWGDMDDEPQRLVEDVKKVGPLGRALKARANLHYGNGIMPFKKTANDGFYTKEPVINPEIEEYFEANYVELNHPEIIRQVETYNMSFVELILNKGRTKIVSHRPIIDPGFCRIVRINPKLGRPETVLVSAEFPSITDDYVTEVPLLDEMDPIRHLRESKGYKYIMRVRHNDGSLYYSSPIWNALRENGWLAIAKSIPEIKAAIFENQMTLKYHVEVSELFLKARYPNWDSFDEKTRKTKFDALLEEIDKRLKGNDKAGKSILSIIGVDPRINKELPGVKINVLKHEFNDGLYNLDTATVNSELLFTVGLHPSLLGHGVPGGKELSGSGSDIRMSMLAHQAQLPAERAVTLHPLKVISRFNGWGVNFGYMDRDISQTLDKNPTGSRNTA